MMKSVLFLFLILSLPCSSRAESGAHQNPTTENLPQRPVEGNSPQNEATSDFLKCENKIKELLPKYLENQKSQFHFHVMLACSGLEGDPVPRKNWKTTLPNCPPTPPRGALWTSDNEKFLTQYHTCADSCYRHSSKLSWREIISQQRQLIRQLPNDLKKQYAWYEKLDSEDIDILNRHYPGQQCCYYKGKLVTDGPGAGTPDVIFMTPSLTPKRLRPTGPLRAALFHDMFDVEIIKTRFLKWPKGWKDYWDLGWSPSESKAPRFWGKDSRRRSCEDFKN